MQREAEHPLDVDGLLLVLVVRAPDRALHLELEEFVHFALARPVPQHRPEGLEDGRQELLGVLLHRPAHAHFCELRVQLPEVVRERVRPHLVVLHGLVPERPEQLLRSVNDVLLAIVERQRIARLEPRHVPHQLRHAAHHLEDGGHVAGVADVLQAVGELLVLARPVEQHQELHPLLPVGSQASQRVDHPPPVLDISDVVLVVLVQPRILQVTHNIGVVPQLPIPVMPVRFLRLES
mmetsp:Transcript_40614/g.95690  ORF Transcript_40614/g.95690 Transcript_40614/m.95690 type:complete len:236 (-) Transcript_40614:1415-2122(-)